MGTVTKVYVSLPSVNSDCSDLGLPALGGGYTYVCSTSANYRNIDGTGWIPVDFTSIQASAGNLFSALPTDPINTVANDYYYTYIPGSWALSATMESTKYIDANAAMDGGQVSARYEVGNEIALNANLGWVCGDTLIDSRDSKEYATVEIGTQCWMAQNMNVGTKITSCTNGYLGECTVGADTVQNQGTSCSSIQKYCYNDTESNCTTDGGFYQWNQAMCGSVIEGAQGICPTGWHIPTDAEWKILVEGQATAGCASSTGWQCSPAGSHLSNDTPGHDNSSGFSGDMVGIRYIQGIYANQSVYLIFWTSRVSGGEAWLYNLNSGYATVNRGTNSKGYGFSIRCLKD